VQLDLQRAGGVLGEVVRVQLAELGGSDEEGRRT